MQCREPDTRAEDTMAVNTRMEVERASYNLHSTYPKRLRAFGSNGRICSVCWEMGNLFAEKINKFHVQHSEVLRNRNMVVIIIYFIVIFD